MSGILIYSDFFHLNVTKIINNHIMLCGFLNHYAEIIPMKNTNNLSQKNNLSLISLFSNCCKCVHTLF